MKKIVDALKQKGHTLTKEQEDYLNELDSAFEAKNAESFAEVKKQYEAWQKDQGEKSGTLEKGLNDLKETVRVMKDAADKNQEAVDKLIANQKQINLGGDAENAKQLLYDGLKAKSKELSSYKDNRSPIIISLDGVTDMQTKAVGDMGSGNFTISGTQTFAGPTMLPGVAGPAWPNPRMREILGTTPIQTDSVSVIRGSVGEGGPTTVAAGGLKPQSDADYVKVIVPVTKIAHHYDIPEEWLEDVTWLADDITNIGVNELMKLENQKIISNTAGAGEFGGLIQNSTAYVGPTGLLNAVASANEYDVLVAAETQLRNLNRTPNFIATDNDTFAKMVLVKATTGEYVFGAPNITMPNVFGVPIYPMNVSTLADKFIVGDRNYATVAVRKGITVRFYDQHANNAIYNMVTVVIEERIALIVKRTDAFIYGGFTSAKTRLDPAVVDA